jgi:hypothetical protein
MLQVLANLHVYTGEIKVVKKNDTVTYDKMPSFTGEEAARILEHWLEIISVVCTSNEEFEGVAAVGAKAMEYHNELNKRVVKNHEEMWRLTDEERSQRLNQKVTQKAGRLQVLGNEFMGLYVAGADPESVTHYVVAMTTIIPEQSRVLRVLKTKKMAP